MDLTGKLLVAMPGLQDPRFDHAVIVMCAHDAGGAMGLIVNKPLQDMAFSDLLDHLSMARGEHTRTVPCLYGGPVEPGRGFVLHGAARRPGDGQRALAPGLWLTSTRDILADLALGLGPKQVLVAMGYAGWAPGQLEEEIARNDWLTVDCTADLVFSEEAGAKWAGALAVLGIDARALSAQAGRA